MSMTSDMEGRIAVVTGAGGGIGAATARLLAERGAQVIATDINLETVTDVARQIKEDIPSSVVRPERLDVAKRSSVGDLAGVVERDFGRLDYLVNNAGIVTMQNSIDLQDEDWDKVLDVNLKGPWLVTQGFWKLLALAQAPSIVNLSTVEAEVVVTSSFSSQPHYNASKGGVKMLTKALAVDLARHGIRVNAVAPGPVATNFVSLEAVTSAESMEFFSQRLLIKRVAEPIDIARAIAFLLSSEASYITGTQLAVDGGWLAQ